MVVLSFFFASICSWMLYLPVQWNKFTPTSGYLARHGQPMRRHQAQGRGLGARNTVGLTHQRGNPASASSAAKALGSPAVASPYPFSDFTNADDAETSRQRMMMSKHSEQHRTLIDLLRERGTLGQDERVPEDDIFDDEAEAEARGFRQGYGGPGGKDEGTFATALAEPRVVYAPGSLGGFVPPISAPVHGARVGGERGNNVPHVVSIRGLKQWDRRWLIVWRVSVAKLRVSSGYVHLLLSRMRNANLSPCSSRFLQNVGPAKERRYQRFEGCRD
jgi:hypothetical protein